MCVLILSTTLPEIFLIVRINQRDTIINFLGIDPQWCRWGFFSEATDGTMCPGVDSDSKNEYQENS